MLYKEVSTAKEIFRIKVMFWLGKKNQATEYRRIFQTPVSRNTGICTV
jgi:hypothetical protein